MKRAGLAVAFVAAAACQGSQAADRRQPDAPTGTEIGRTIPAFTAQAIDVAGGAPVARAFDSHATERITVYAFLGTKCPSTRLYLERLRALESTYRAKGVDFVYLYPNRRESSDEKRRFHAEQGFTGPMIDDVGGAISVGTLAARRTSEILVVDANRAIRYRGAIDDSKRAEGVTRQHLAIALDELLVGKDVTQPASNVFA